MDPALIIFGIQSIIRLGKITKDASEQYARDAEALFPNIRAPDFNRKTYVDGFFGSADYKAYVRGARAPYKAYWGAHGAKNDLDALDTLFAAAVRIKAEEGVDLQRWLSDSQMMAGAALIEQWDPRKAPLSPFARIVLAAADIVLEYVAIHPGIIGVSGNGEKLIGAYAQNLSALLPDDGKFGGREKFAERLLGVFLRAGLDTIGRHPQWVVSESHVQQLIAASVTPIVAALPGGITEQLAYREVTEALIGPAASAAMQVLAEHPAEFMGPAFDAETAMGALTQALLGQVAKTGLNRQFAREGLLDLYRAALGVAARQPQLFLDAGGGPPGQLARDLMANFATVLMDTPPPFDGDIAGRLAAATLDAVGANAHRFAEKDQPWHQTAADMVAHLAGSLSTAFRTNQDIGRVFSKDQLVELGRIILNHVAATPRMVAGPQEVLQPLTAAVAQAMAKDKHLLLNGDDWLEIVNVAAREAAANPGRLFQLLPDDPMRSLVARVIAALLESAGAVMDQATLRGKAVLFGQTLRQAIVIAVQATAGNPEAAGRNLAGIGALSRRLNDLVVHHADKFGSKEWLYLFRTLLSAVLEGDAVGTLTVEKAEKLLLGRPS